MHCIFIQLIEIYLLALNKKNPCIKGSMRPSSFWIWKLRFECKDLHGILIQLKSFLLVSERFSPVHRASYKRPARCRKNIFQQKFHQKICQFSPSSSETSRRRTLQKRCKLCKNRPIYFGRFSSDPLKINPIRSEESIWIEQTNRHRLLVIHIYIYNRCVICFHLLIPFRTASHVYEFISKYFKFPHH